MPTFWKQDTIWNKPVKKKETNPEDKVWTACSNYIRIRDCLRTTGTIEAGRCVTSNEIIPMKGSDAGHYISRGRGATKYHPMNIHLQSVKDNRFQQGNWIAYREFMLDFYGKEKTEWLEMMSKALEEKWIDWDEKAKYWRTLAKTLTTFHHSSGMSQLQTRQFITDHMKRGTLEEFLINIANK